MNIVSAATAYTTALTDRGAVVQLSGTSDTNLAVSLVSTAGVLPAGWSCTFENISAGTTLVNSTAVLTPTSGTISVNGVSGSTFSLYPGDIFSVSFNGTNWTGWLFGSNNVFWTLCTSPFTWAVSGGSPAFPGNNVLAAAFPATQDVFTVQASSRYQFEALLDIACPAGGSPASHNIQFGFGTSGATFTDILYDSLVNQGTQYGIVTSPSAKLTNAATATALAGSGTLASHAVRIRGAFLIGTGGTITPSIAMSADPGGGGTITVGTDSFFRCWRIGNATAFARGLWA